MLPLRKRWQIANRLPPETDKLLDSYPPILRQILYNRGYATPEKASAYLEARPPEGTDPLSMLGMSEAVARLEIALQRGESMAVYGDYDVDGVTATALLVEAFKPLGARVRAYIPNRFDEGYGLNREALETLKEEGTDLVITVDCGIRSPAEAEYARQIGLDLIISDHHHPGDELPEAVAVINPRQPGDAYPDKDLAGVGLAYKILSVLLATRSQASQSPPGEGGAESYLDLVALGTVADLAPLVGENRALVRAGINQLHKPVRQGVRSLMAIAGVQAERLRATDIGFMLGPRLNAAGRIDTALDALALLTTKDVQVAGRLAQQLDVQNRERQSITRDIQEHAEQAALAAEADPLILFAAHPDYNPGVVGLAASRLTDQYYRPAIVAQRGEEFTRGSCRSISEFHITEALDQCADLLEHYGGHAAAAGFTVKNENLPELIQRLREIASQQLSPHDLRPTMVADAEMNLLDLKPDLLDYLERLQPTGYGNRQALFVSRDVQVMAWRAVGKDGDHLKLTVSDGWITFDAIAFRQGYWQDLLPPKIDLMYTFELNEYKGRSALQLNVRDIKPAGMPD